MTDLDVAGAVVSAGTAPQTVGASQPPPAPPRPRIDSISIQNFRGFPGVGNPEIKLGGKNLLVYGENGSGKSSIFHALDQFFSLSEKNRTARQALLQDQTNIYSGVGSDATSVTVAFVDGLSFVWDETSHPVDAPPKSVVVSGAYRKAMLDYRALLAVNYKFLGDRINLFEAIVNVLLRDLAVPYRGSEKPLSAIWEEAQTEFKGYHFQSRRNNVDARLNAINQAIDNAHPPLRGEANRLLGLLSWADLEIDNFDFPHLNCNWTAPRPKREIKGKRFLFTLKQQGVEVEDPHHFLNEARQSGLALALYLAGRCIMSKTMQADAPKLMVLDDVLIGLDQSNRLPILDLLKSEFTDWQIILLTYDRVWFEMARAHLGEAEWVGLEVFQGLDEDGHTHPVPRPLHNFDAVLGNLATARAFRAAYHDKAAAVHARMAFEQVLKKFCGRKGVPVPFEENPRRLTADQLFSALKGWLNQPKWATQHAALQPKIVALEAVRSVVLNAFSHSTPVSLASKEIDLAINAVESLHLELNSQFPK